MYSFNTGGLENGLVNLINHLPEDRFFHVICILSEGKSSASKLTRNNVCYYELRKRDGNDVSIPFKIASIIRKEKIDLVHSRNWVSLVEGVAGAILAGCKPIVHSEHGKEIDDLVQKSRLRHLAKRLCYRWVDTVITVSKSLYQEIVDRQECRPSKVIPIINGVDCQRFRPDRARRAALARESFGIPEGKFVIGSVGRLAPVKNYRLMVELCSCLDPDRFVFVLVGDGPERPPLEQAIRDSGVADRFFLLGELGDVSTVLCCFDLFINTSEYEGISNTILEAMASGVPVLAHDVGGNKELVTDGETGFLIPGNDRDEFIKKILALSGYGELYRTLAHSSRVAAQNRFSLEAMVQNYAEQYLRCLPQRRG